MLLLATTWLCLATTVLTSPLASASTSTSTSTNDSTPLIGPANGHLVIVGGNLQSPIIWNKIIDLGGGPSSPIVVIPTAGGDETYDDDTFPAAETLRSLGAQKVVVLHTYDRTVADTEEFVAPLRTAGAVFFGGGRQWRLVDAYADTLTETALRSVLDRGGVIAGSSAGATIQGSFLARGDTANNQIMIGDHTVGFGYLKHTAIDQHFLVRNRHFDMFDILDPYPDLLGLSIDEDTALVVTGGQDVAEVLGRSYVAVYDKGFWSDEGTELKTLPSEDRRFYFLKEGDRYHLGQRKVLEDPEGRGGGGGGGS